MDRLEKVNERAQSKKNCARDAAIWALPSTGMLISVDLVDAPKNSSCTTSWATMRDIFPDSVVLDCVKKRKKKF
jgi:hypothetical protein